ncbi:MAG: protocatechuate 3,4-dioxygenase [Hellea sp.]
MTENNSNRRSFLTRLSAGLSLLFVFRNSHAQTPKTPDAIEGPYYPKPSIRSQDIDNDLVKIEGVVTEAGGEVVILNGVISDDTGAPVEGLRIEIWQCDINGKYLSNRDRRKIKHDIAFQGFGHDITNEKGEYSFRTIKPGKYPGRTEHIHVKILRGRKEILTTQFYVEDGPNNEGDWIYRRLSSAEAETVTMRFVDENSLPQATVNIVV